MVVPLWMGWRHLAFVNWPLNSATVAAHLPPSLEVDTYDGRAWLSMVHYLNVTVRPRGVPATAGFVLRYLWVLGGKSDERGVTRRGVDT